MKTFILLGRNGDLLNLLPLLRWYSRRDQERPRFMVAKEFAPLLDGVSYVEPVIWSYDWRDARLAWQMAHGDPLNGEVINCTVYARDYQCRRLAKNFEREAWFNAGADIPWGTMPLEFDRRDPAREARLIDSFELSGRPLLLTSFSGTSAPFMRAAQLSEKLAERFPDFEIVDLSRVRAERLFDFIGLFEIATALVCTDSAPLHLAMAVPRLPVAALIPEHPAPKKEWCRAEWTPQQVFQCLHEEALGKIDELAAVLRDPGLRPKIVHVSAWIGTPKPDDARRIEVAQTSWRNEYTSGRWDPLPLGPSLLPRNALSIGDVNPLPFIRDMIEAAAKRCRPADIICLSNADVGFTPGLTGWVIESVGRQGSAFAHRWDFHRRLDEPVLSDIFVGEGGNWYPGSDFFAFSREWWDRYGREYPDMILGREAGDMVLRQLIKKTGGAELSRAIWHEKHASQWEQTGAREKLAGNVINRSLASAWLSTRRLPWDDWRTPSNLLLHRRRVA